MDYLLQNMNRVFETKELEHSNRVLIEF